MKNKKQKLLEAAMLDFENAGGGTKVDPKYVVKDVHLLKENLQKSFDMIFPELMKAPKHRKHVIFDDDIFRFFAGLSDDNGSKFSSMINSALRSFVRERLLSSSIDRDPVAELLSVRERERELLKEIKELNLTEELQQKLG